MKKFISLFIACTFFIHMALAQSVSLKDGTILKDGEPYAKLIKTGGLRPQYSLQTLDGKEIFVGKCMDPSSNLFTIIFMDDNAQAYSTYLIGMGNRLAKDIVENNLIVNNALNPQGKSRFIALHPIDGAKTSTAAPAASNNISDNMGSSDAYEMGSVDRLPTYPGGNQMMQMYFKSSIMYPANDRAQGIQGDVKVRFMVNTQGQVRNITVISTPTPEMGNEAIRVLKNMPSWTPGMKDAKPVNVYYVMYVPFSLH